MSSSLPMLVAETIQTASIKRNPSPSHDINPSTSASQKQPVRFSNQGLSSESSLDKCAYDDEGIDDEEDEEDEEIPYSVLRPTPRRASFGPLPDLRFEQSYLASIAKADTKWKVAFITIRDQVFLPLFQGMIWNLTLHGWRYWNRSAQLSGEGVGARVRRWWYRTNNWKLPSFARDFRRDTKLSAEVGDYYKYQNMGGD
ncbi:DUF1770-domain-containing protein [Venustampulla echinocandica]|uniref:DUF1770-domain-containing protein n=1 Tax=Venustampulla echinocandica TaxID=2656787 RepID=A0A370TI66_9HELO|nr:DUF1770-domain-containing protein [Venustampulla echinocandica]RDL35042.1 DUF1770-domain-containing protein [Venustampulla echinocandica]